MRVLLCCSSFRKPLLSSVSVSWGEHEAALGNALWGAVVGWILELRSVMVKHVGDAAPACSSPAPQNQVTTHKPVWVIVPELHVQSEEQVFNCWKFESEKGHKSSLKNPEFYNPRSKPSWAVLDSVHKKLSHCGILHLFCLKPSTFWSSPKGNPLNHEERAAVSPVQANSSCSGNLSLA